MAQMAGQMLTEAGGWDAMSGQRVCAKPGLVQMPVSSCRLHHLTMHPILLSLRACVLPVPLL